VVHVGVDYKHGSQYSIYDEESRQNLHRAITGNLRSLSFPRFGAHYKNHVRKRTNTPFFTQLSKSQIRNLREHDISALTDEHPQIRISRLFDQRMVPTMDFAFQGTNFSRNFYWIPPLPCLLLCNLASHSQRDCSSLSSSNTIISGSWKLSNGIGTMVH